MADFLQVAQNSERVAVAICVRTVHMRAEPKRRRCRDPGWGRLAHSPTRARLCCTEIQEVPAWLDYFGAGKKSSLEGLHVC